MIKVNEQGFVYSTEGFWLPPINLKQYEVWEDYHRYTLIHGPRKSSKTYGVCHKFLRHAFDNNGAMQAVLVKTIKNAKSSGVWSLLTEEILPVWKTAGMGFKVVEAPRVSGDTKLSFFKIRNRFGTVSTIQCHSLEHASEVEGKFKGQFFSAFWVSEADQFLDEHAFHILCDCLRMTPRIPYREHQMILDMNPPDTGPNNFFHDLWFKYKDHPPAIDPAFNPVFHEGLHRIGFKLDDNPQLDPNERAELISRYMKRKTLFNRFVLGMWEQDVTDGHFSDVYDESVHIRGTTDGPEEDREQLIPTAGCTQLLAGWDIGMSKNHSFHILEKIIREDPVTRRKHVSFSVLDEFVVIRTYMSIREFTAICQERIEYWNDWQMKQQNVTLMWRHWSDTSAFDPRAGADQTDAAIVYEASEGTIVLQGAPKYRNSNRDKVKLLWQLLYEKRLHISAQLSVTRAMFSNLRSDPKAVAHYVQRDDHKHPFDSLSYPIIAECPSDMLKSAELSTAPRERPSGMVVARM